MKKQIIDIGLNLMHKQFDLDREDVVKRAEKENVTPLIITGVHLNNSKKAANFAEKHIGKLYCTAGIHPHDAKTCNEDTIFELQKLAKKRQVCAIGECGLDYDRNFSPQNIQKKWFEEQIILAEELNMPLFLHERAAFSDFKKIMMNHKEICNHSVVHCFTGNGTELQNYLRMGCFIGITGWICDERRGQHLKTLIKMIPLNKLMIETDAPFLIPRDLKLPVQNKRNEPIYLRHILKVISKCLNKEEDELAEILTNNTKEFFHI